MERIDLQLVATAIIGVGIYWVLTSGLVGWAWDALMTWREDWLADRWDRRHGVMSWGGEEEEPVRAPNAPVRDGGSTGSSDPVREHQNQLEPVEPAMPEPVREPVILHNLSRQALIALLAVQKNDSNGYRFSKNQIAAFVGGTKADILKEIDLYRDPQPAKQPTPARTDRPANGWNQA